MQLSEDLESITNSFLAEEEGIFLVSFHLKSTGQTKIAVCLDGDKGVTVEQCATISRKLGGYIEDQNLIEGPYKLEVSSPGADSPLIMPRQYHQHLSRRLALLLQNGKEMSGKLLEVKEKSIKIAAEIREKGKKKVKEIEQEILFEDITQAKVILAFK
jgi:ribosome maturation factor RimP